MLGVVIFKKTFKIKMMVVSWHPCAVAVIVVVVVITAIHFFSSVWHFGRSAPVIGALVCMDGLSPADVLADVFVNVFFVEFHFLLLDIHFYI